MTGEGNGDPLPSDGSGWQAKCISKKRAERGQFGERTHRKGSTSSRALGGKLLCLLWETELHGSLKCRCTNAHVMVSKLEK